MSHAHETLARLQTLLLEHPGRAIEMRSAVNATDGKKSIVLSMHQRTHKGGAGVSAELREGWKTNLGLVLAELITMAERELQSSRTLPPQPDTGTGG